MTNTNINKTHDLVLDTVASVNKYTVVPSIYSVINEMCHKKAFT
jgi:hypothetical protein